MRIIIVIIIMFAALIPSTEQGENMIYQSKLHDDIVAIRQLRGQVKYSSSNGHLL